MEPDDHHPFVVAAFQDEPAAAARYGIDIDDFHALKNCSPAQAFDSTGLSLFDDAVLNQEPVLLLRAALVRYAFDTALAPLLRPHEGQFNEVLYRRNLDGSLTSYMVYDVNGKPVKRVDLTGAPHAGIPTPHVVEFVVNTNPQTGETFHRPGDEVRPARADEIPTHNP
jgi:hypothetical protein